MKSPSGIMQRLTLAMVLLGLALPALPQATDYAIEIIVFRNDSDAGALTESAARPVFAGGDVSATTAAPRKLGGTVARLNNGGLRVLGHAAWRQAPTAFWRPTISSGADSRPGVATTRLGLSGISGKVIFERGQYLHLGVDLLVEDRGKRYRINEVRQVRADEIHYFDHPAIGVLAIVSGN